MSIVYMMHESLPRVTISWSKWGPAQVIVPRVLYKLVHCMTLQAARIPQHSSFLRLTSRACELATTSMCPMQCNRAAQALAAWARCTPALQELTGLFNGILLDAIDARHCHVRLSCQQRLHCVPSLMEDRDHLTANAYTQISSNQGKNTSQCCSQCS